MGGGRGVSNLPGRGWVINGCVTMKKPPPSTRFWGEWGGTTPWATHRWILLACCWSSVFFKIFFPGGRKGWFGVHTCIRCFTLNLQCTLYTCRQNVKALPQPQIRQSAGLSLQSSEWLPPPPHPRPSVAPPPIGSKGGGKLTLAGKGARGANSNEETDTLGIA